MNPATFGLTKEQIAVIELEHKAHAMFSLHEALEACRSHHLSDVFRAALNAEINRLRHEVYCLDARIDDLKHGIDIGA